MSGQMWIRRGHSTWTAHSMRLLEDKILLHQHVYSAAHTTCVPTPPRRVFFVASVTASNETGCCDLADWLPRRCTVTTLLHREVGEALARPRCRRAVGPAGQTRRRGWLSRGPRCAASQRLELHDAEWYLTLQWPLACGLRWLQSSFTWYCS